MFRESGFPKTVNWIYVLGFDRNFESLKSDFEWVIAYHNP